MVNKVVYIKQVPVSSCPVPSSCLISETVNDDTIVSSISNLWLWLQDVLNKYQLGLTKTSKMLQKFHVERARQLICLIKI